MYKATLDLKIIQQDNKPTFMVAAMEDGASAPEYDDKEMDSINTV